MVIWATWSAFRTTDGIHLNCYTGGISDVDRASPPRLGKGGRTPECLWGWTLGKNGAIMDSAQGLTEGGLIKDFRRSNSMGAYQFKGGII